MYANRSQSNPHVTATAVGRLAPPLPAESTIVDIVELYDALSDEFRNGVPKDPDEMLFIFAAAARLREALR